MKPDRPEWLTELILKLQLILDDTRLHLGRLNLGRLDQCCLPDQSCFHRHFPSLDSLHIPLVTSMVSTNDADDIF
jgi:hypothetical protein